MTHTEAAAKFKKCRNKETGYKLANNTRLQKRGNAFAVRLHETDVVMIRPDGTYRVNTGGWRTITTKDRINRFIPGCGIHQDQSVWYFGNIMFQDGMLINPDGNVVGDDHVPATALKNVKKSVNHYCRKFGNHVIEACMGHDIGEMEEYTKYPIPVVTNKGHIANFWKAVNESYRSARWYDTPSLYHKWAYLAIASRQYGNPQFIWDIVRRECLRGIEPFMLKDSLRSFIRVRKPSIIDQVAFGDLKVRKIMT